MTASPRKLNPKQELFCKLYATDREFFGNGVQAYIEAYDPPRESKAWYVAARVSASDHLTKPYIIDRINSLLEESGHNDINVDKQLLFIINQHADFKSKVAAIREYNKLKARITQKSEVNITGVAISAAQAEQLIRARAKRSDS